MSKIIKADYVVYQDKEHELVHNNGLGYPEQEDLYQIYEQKETIINEAREEATLIIETAKINAQDEIEQYKKKAYEESYDLGLQVGIEEGYKIGYDDGLKTVKTELNEKNEVLLDEIKSMIIALENEKDAIISKFEKDIARVSIDIAEKIVKQKINSSDNMIIKTIEDVIKNYKNVEWIKIYLSEQDDYKLVEADRTIINELNNISDNVKIEAMGDLEKGNCIIETPDDIVDAGLITQLNNLKEIVMNN